MTKRKEERKELLKEDEIHSALDRIARYIQDNPSRVAGYTLGVFGLLAVFFWWTNHLEEKRKQQSEVLYQAEKVLSTNLDDERAPLKFDSEDAKNEKALEELNKVIDAESGVVRQQALVHKVSVLINLGRQDEVEALYQELIKEDKGFKVFGMMGLADMYLAEGEYDKALTAYDELVEVRTLDLSDLVSYKRANALKEKGDKQAAYDALVSLIDKYAEKEAEEKPSSLIYKAERLRDELKLELGIEDEEQAS